MSAAAISKLAAHVLDIHSNHQNPGQLTVIPVVLVAPSSGPSDVEALALALQDADGALVVATDNAAGVRGTINDDLKQIIDEVLDAAGRADLVIQQQGDAVVAGTADGGTAATASEAQRVLFGLLTSLFDQRVVGSELAAIVYDESEFDAPTADWVWSLCAAHLIRIAWPNLKTLVIVARAGRPVPERHYRSKASARYVVNGPWLDVRRSWETDRTDVARIAGQSERIVLFLAAGFSTSSKTDDGEPLALGNELRDRALRRLLHESGSGDAMARQYLRYCKERGSLLPGEEHVTEQAFAAALTLERVLVDELNDPPDALGPTLTEFKEEVEQAHQRLGTAVEGLGRFLASTARRVVLVTVNLDDLVEHHCLEYVDPILTDQDFASAAEKIGAYWKDGGKSPLLQLHGSLNDPATLVASIHSVELGLSDAKINALDAALLDAGGHRTTVCYVGSSMRDRDLNQLLGLRRYAERLDEWWIAPTIAQSVREFIDAFRHRRWQVLGAPSEPEARCITVIADDFLAALADTV